MKYFNEDYILPQKILYSVLGIVFILLSLFQIYLFNALSKIETTLTKLIYLLIIIVVFLILLATLYYFVIFAIAVFKFIIDIFLKIFEFLKNINIYYRHFVNTMALIWNNRNKYPFSIFGGFYYYLRLRAKVVGLLFLFAFFFLIFIKSVDYYKNYHRTYWKHSFFPGDNVGEYIFLPDKYYTIATEDDISAVLINKLLYEINEHTPLPHKWHIKFTDTVTFSMWIYYDVVKNSYTPLSYEIWEDKQEGASIDTNILKKYLPSKPRWNKHPKNK